VRKIQHWLLLARRVADKRRQRGHRGIDPYCQEHQERLTLRVSSRLGSRLSAIAKQHAISKNQLIVDVLEREFA
jgi:predicted HicB family RNase H-like nuclease